MCPTRTRRQQPPREAGTLSHLYTWPAWACRLAAWAGQASTGQCLDARSHKDSQNLKAIRVLDNTATDYTGHRCSDSTADLSRIGESCTQADVGCPAYPKHSGKGNFNKGSSTVWTCSPHMGVT